MWNMHFQIELLSLLFSYPVVSSSSLTSWSVARQAPLSLEFPRQEYWSRLPSTQGRAPCLLHWQVNSLPLSHLRTPSNAVNNAKLFISQRLFHFTPPPTVCKVFHCTTVLISSYYCLSF